MKNDCTIEKIRNMLGRRADALRGVADKIKQSAAFLETLKRGDIVLAKEGPEGYYLGLFQGLITEIAFHTQPLASSDLVFTAPSKTKTQPEFVLHWESFQRYIWQVVPRRDLPCWLHLKYKTALFDQMVKGETSEKPDTGRD